MLIFMFSAQVNRWLVNLAMQWTHLAPFNTTHRPHMFLGSLLFWCAPLRWLDDPSGISNNFATSPKWKKRQPHSLQANAHKLPSQTSVCSLSSEFLKISTKKKKYLKERSLLLLYQLPQPIFPNVTATLKIPSDILHWTVDTEQLCNCEAYETTHFSPNKEQLRMWAPENGDLPVKIIFI